MKIDPQIPLTRPSQSESARDVRTVDSSTSLKPTDGEPSSMVHLNGDSRQDIDVERVAEIRDAIREGRLDINPERIADGLIDSVRDLLGQERK
ncbi:flagellar biosynthesis anti-sigma factor FlgM [Halomonas huangheensis]|uniref:Negative regulator of flagellin synthesis n=1 Tax=Halomonas huangheensis TaxID=1178482 RepID=W1N5P4_9GAMM|nr:flagellar biosynthesis anti-sigma factor FlgM [Halomonas huangheensis]ALM54261.1 hypothetical protein AR456_19800 [Halomonas huangheensis]ERL50809.1 hypothetical protein BJB45_19630 [Halomonas huangheensis]